MSVMVKICGITNLGDALRAVDFGADALGFVFHEQSPRRISVNLARSIVEALPPFVTTGGVFVNETIDRMREARREAGLDLLQLHGDESPETASALAPSVIKAIRIRGLESLETIVGYAPRAFLLDAHADAAYGGTGLKFDWDVARWVEDVPVIIAGGLTPDNVAEAVRVTRPYGVDVSTGVESEPGKKDPARLKAFIQNAKAAP